MAMVVFKQKVETYSKPVKSTYGYHIIFIDDFEINPLVTEGEYKLRQKNVSLLVENKIVVELKAIKNIDDTHFAIVRSYLKSIKQKHGLILNFNKRTLEIKRVINEF